MLTSLLILFVSCTDSSGPVPAYHKGTWSSTAEDSPVLVFSRSSVRAGTSVNTAVPLEKYAATASRQPGAVGKVEYTMIGDVLQAEVTISYSGLSEVVTITFTKPVNDKFTMTSNDGGETYSLIYTKN